MGHFVSKAFSGRIEQTTKVISAFRRPACWIPTVILLLFLFVSRLWGLGDKPYHHDESLYAVTSWKYLTQGVYKFLPMLHGPFLFHLQAFLFSLLPVSDFTGRLPSVLAGLLLPFLAFPLFHNGRILSFVVFLGLVATSPTFCYFSRFLGMDVLMVSLFVSLLVCLHHLWREKSIWHLYLASACFALMVCTKLNFVFYALSLIVFFGFWLRYHHMGVARICKDLGIHWKHWIGACLLFVFIFCLLFSSLGSNPGGILDGLYRAMIPYWLNQHSIQRIAGPFHYYLPLLAIYELPLLVGVVVCVSAMLIKDSWAKKRLLILCAASIALYLGCLVGWSTLQYVFSTFFHMNQPWHLSLLLLEMGVGCILISWHLRKGQGFEAFFMAWGCTSLIFYSYAGEKVPWLAPHVIVPWIFYGAFLIPVWVQKARFISFRWALAVLVGLITLWQGWNTIRSSIVWSANPRERLVYTHTSWDTKNLATRMYALSASTGFGRELSIQVPQQSYAVWPLAWYLRDFTHWFYLDINPSRHPAVVIHDWERRGSTRKALGENYKMERVKLRQWWVPDPTQATLRSVFRYYIDRTVFSPLGSQDLAVFVATDLRSH